MVETVTPGGQPACISSISNTDTHLFVCFIKTASGIGEIRSVDAGDQPLLRPAGLGVAGAASFLTFFVYWLFFPVGLTDGLLLSGVDRGQLDTIAGSSFNDFLLA